MTTNIEIFTSLMETKTASTPSTSDQIKIVALLTALDIQQLTLEPSLIKRLFESTGYELIDELSSCVLLLTKENLLTQDTLTQVTESGINPKLTQLIIFIHKNKLESIVTTDTLKIISSLSVDKIRSILDYHVKHALALTHENLTSLLSSGDKITIVDILCSTENDSGAFTASDFNAITTMSDSLTSRVKKYVQSYLTARKRRKTQAYFLSARLKHLISFFEYNEKNNYEVTHQDAHQFCNHMEALDPALVDDWQISTLPHIYAECVSILTPTSQASQDDICQLIQKYGKKASCIAKLISHKLANLSAEQVDLDHLSRLNLDKSHTLINLFIQFKSIDPEFVLPKPCMLQPSNIEPLLKALQMIQSKGFATPAIMKLFIGYCHNQNTVWQEILVKALRALDKNGMFTEETITTMLSNQHCLALVYFTDDYFKDKELDDIANDDTGTDENGLSVEAENALYKKILEYDYTSQSKQDDWCNHLRNLAPKWTGAIFSPILSIVRYQTLNIYITMVNNLTSVNRPEATTHDTKAQRLPSPTP